MNLNILENVYKCFASESIDKLLRFYDKEYRCIRLLSNKELGRGRNFVKSHFEVMLQQYKRMHISEIIECDDFIVTKLVCESTEGLKEYSLVVYYFEKGLILEEYRLEMGYSPFEETAENVFSQYNNQDLRRLSSNWTTDIEYRKLRTNELVGKGVDWINAKDEKEFIENWQIKLLSVLSSDMFVASHISYKNQAGQRGSGVKLFRYREDKVSHVYEL